MSFEGEKFEEIPTPPEEEIEKVEEETKTEEEITKIRRIEPEEKEFENYFQNYSDLSIAQTHMDNAKNFNSEGTFLYEVTKGEKEKKLNHLIWVYREIESRKPIPSQEWQKWNNKPEIIERANTTLLESYSAAIDFYPWKIRPPRGFVMEGIKYHGMEPSGPLGFTISYSEIEPLLKVIENKNEKELKEIKTHLAASFVHELTHEEREDGLGGGFKIEIGSHIAQFIFEPKNNEIFNQQLEDSLSKIEEIRIAKEKEEILGNYEKASYSALLIIADKLANYNEKCKEMLIQDKDPNKLNTLRKLRDFIEEKERKYLKDTVLPEIMRTECEELGEKAKEIEKKLGIAKSVIETK